jgi:hypothetical protein
MQERFAAPATTGGVSQMQERFAASRTLSYVKLVTPFTGLPELGDDTVPQVSEICS